MGGEINVQNNIGSNVFLPIVYRSVHLVLDIQWCVDRLGSAAMG